jgi:molybdenum cofactor synthesis domain-containing protein
MTPPSVPPRTAAALIIGNEILSGKTQESNLVVLARTLRGLGILLRRVVVVGDDMDAITHEVRDLCRNNDLVFTSGGVGPTHDDVTTEAVARAFGARVVTSPELEALLRDHYGARCTEAHLRMAFIPEGAEQLTCRDSPWPAVVMKNVWLLPGIPEVFRMKIPIIVQHIRGARPFVSRAVYTRMDEGDLKPLLDLVVKGHPRVDVGSYPKWADPDCMTMLTFDGTDGDAVARAVAAFVSLLPRGEPRRIE